MNKLELQVLYKKETGRNLPESEFVSDEDGEDFIIITKELEDYIIWLEEKIFDNINMFDYIK